MPTQAYQSTHTGAEIDAAVDAISEVITVYSGSSAPQSSLGSDGDIYIQTS